MPQQIPNTGANARTLDTFKSKMLGGGVRPNFFEVELKFPALAIDDNDISDKTRFLVKGANLELGIFFECEVTGDMLKIMETQNHFLVFKSEFIREESLIQNG